MLTVERWPELHDAVMILAFSGWIDAGLAGAGAITVLQEQLRDGEEFATFDLTDLTDLQQTRPVARWDDDARVIEWPTMTFASGSLGRDLVIVCGPEPSSRWFEVTRMIVDAARRTGVREAFTLAGMPAIVSHRKPIPVLATATHRSLAQEMAPLRGAYAGPTGLQTVVQRALGDADIRSAGLWAQVPQYVAGSPSPPAVRALLRRLAELARLDIDLHPLDARCDAYVARVDEGLAARPDVRDVVDRIDREQTVSSDDLVSEIEQFLRQQGDDA
jgi:predicted ATP-grasp superfamily ATP-dependent carboligase